MGEQTAAMDPVQGYEERLAALLQQCAEDFQTRPDAFLWNCRRCLECVAYAQLSSQQQNYQPGSREGELSNFAGKLPRKLQDEWRFVVGKSNLAVHVTGPVVGDLFEDARTCKEQLDKIVRWYFDPDNTRADRLSRTHSRHRSFNSAPYRNNARENLNGVSCSSHRRWNISRTGTPLHRHWIQDGTVSLALPDERISGSGASSQERETARFLMPS